MFGLGKKELPKIAGLSQTVAKSKKPTPMAPHTNVIPIGAYEELATELGFLPSKLLEEQLLRFLAEQKIPVYNYNEVHLYLKQKAKEQGKYYIWRPLREQDKPSGWHMSSQEGNDGDEDTFGEGHGSYHNGWDYRPYDKIIPIHILQRVKKIAEKFPSALFFVSDYAIPNPDPFIMVTALDVQRIVFGVWDEPAFEANETD